jgi:hypothetical protein
MRRLRDSGGQATSEYVALVALVAVVLVLAAGLTSGGIGGRVLAGMQRALCHVMGGGCPRVAPPAADLAPCPLERSLRVERLSETIAVVRLGTSGTLSAVRSSDGRVAVTLANGSTAGGEIGAGVRLKLRDRPLGGAATGGLAATWTSGRSWTFPDAAAARDFVSRYGSKETIGGKLIDEIRSRCSLLCDAIGWRPHPQLPPPDELDEEGGATASLGASLGLPGRSGSASATATAVLGRRIERDGATTWYLRADAATTAGLHLPAAALAGDAAGEAVLSYGLDAHGRPLALGVHLAGRAGATATAGNARGAHVDGQRAAVVELDATLDLREPENRAAAAALLDALGDPARLGAAPRRAAALGRRIAQRAQIDVRTYALRERTGGIGATVGLGVELGGAFERTTQGLRLLSAQTRLPGLPFLPRDDCRDA